MRPQYPSEFEPNIGRKAPQAVLADMKARRQLPMPSGAVKHTAECYGSRAGHNK